MNDIMVKLQKHYNQVESQICPSHNFVGVFLQGSQNYNLDYEGSDIDSKCIVLPSFVDVILNHPPVSTTHVTEEDEHIDLKDIRLMMECFKKQNINFIEVLFTKYKIMNPKYEKMFQPMFDNNEKIARYNNYSAITCISGMCMEKYKALEHPYPSLVDKIEKFGYDPKQLHHIVRLNEFAVRYINGEPYKDCLISKNRNYLIDIKRGIHTLDEAREIGKRITDETIELRKKYMGNNPVKVDKEVETILNNVLFDIIKYYFKTELLKENIK
jgi:hypothetical protein